MGAQDSGTPALPRHKSWLARHVSLLLRRDRQAQKAGQLFSGLLALNVVFLGGAFICSMIFNNVAVTLGDVWILLAVLRTLSLLWLLYYRTSTSRRPHAVLYRDPHAGPIWVRGECGGWAGAGWWGGRVVPPSANGHRPPRLPAALWRVHHLPQWLPHGLRLEPQPLQVTARAHLPCRGDHLRQHPGNRPLPTPGRTHTRPSLCPGTAPQANAYVAQSLYARHGPQQMPVSVSPHPHSAYTCTGTHHVTELQTLVNPSACACSRVSKPTPVGVQSCSQPRMSGSLLTACSAPGMVLHLHHLFYFHDKWAFPERSAFQSHFRAEETEAQRYHTTGPKAHSKGTVEPGP